MTQEYYLEPPFNSGNVTGEAPFCAGSVSNTSFYSQNPTKTKRGNAYLFVLADEILPSGKLVRKVLMFPDANTASIIAANPEKYGLTAVDPSSKFSIGEHALGNNKSRFISASTFPEGAPNFRGRPVYIDIKKAKAAGVTIHSTEEIIADLNRILANRPELAERIAKLKDAIVNIEGEVLLENKIPASAIKSASAMKVTRYLRYVEFIGFAFTVYDMGNASIKSVEQNSPKPVVAESIRQVGGWSGAVAGMEIGGWAGAAVGIETGPGAIITAAAGALIFGAAGYFGADWIADYIDEN